MRDFSHLFTSVEDRMLPAEKGQLGRTKLIPNPITDSDVAEMFDEARSKGLWFEVVHGVPDDRMTPLIPEHYSPDDYVIESNRCGWKSPKWARSVKLIDPVALLDEKLQGLRASEASLPEWIEKAIAREKAYVDAQRKAVRDFALSIGRTVE